MKDQDPIFVLSYSRSGSNLVTSVIAGATNGVMNLESPHSIIFRKAIRNGNLSAEQWDKMYHLLSNMERQAFNVRPNYNATARTSPVLEFFTNSIINPPGTQSQLIEKHTKHSIFCNQLINTYPRAKFVILIRDCTTVIERRLANNMMRNTSLIYQSKLWEINYNKLWDFHQRFPNQSCIIRFEDLMEKQNQTLTHLANFLGLPPDKLQLNSERQKHLASVLDQPQFEEGKHLGLLDKTSAKESKPIEASIRKKINRICNSVSQKFGYSVGSVDSLSFGDRIQCFKAIYHRKIRFYYFYLLPPGWILRLRKRKVN